MFWSEGMSEGSKEKAEEGKSVWEVVVREYSLMLCATFVVLGLPGIDYHVTRHWLGYGREEAAKAGQREEEEEHQGWGAVVVGVRAFASTWQARAATSPGVSRTN